MADKPNLILTFEVTNGTETSTAEFSSESVTIGSSEEANLRIEHDSVAAQHCVVNVEDDGSVHLLDLGSGVTLNGDKLSSNAALKSGDSFSLGEVSLTIRITDTLALADEVDTAVKKNEAPGVGSAPSEPAGVTPLSELPDITDSEPRTFTEENPEERLTSIENVMDYVKRSGTGDSNLGLNTKRPDVLEVSQLWCNTLIDTRHFPQDRDPITVGASVAYRWEFLGVDMGWVPSRAAKFLPLVPPVWSEVVTDWRNDFYSPNAILPANADHNLFVWRKDSYIARIAKDWTGHAEVDGTTKSFSELVNAGQATVDDEFYEIPIVDDIRIWIEFGLDVTFFAQMVKPGKRILSRMNEELDYPFLVISGIVGFIGLMFGLIMFFSPPPPDNDMLEIPDRFVQLLLEKPEAEKKKEKPNTNPDAGEGEKAKKEEGKTGKKDAKMEKAKGNKVKQKEKDRKIAENAGVLGALRESGDLDGIFGTSGLSSDLRGGIGGLIGAKGTQSGSGGVGSRGSGLGGGGTAEGLGGLGTKGIGSGRSGYGKGGGSVGPKGEGGIGAVGGDPIILGALDRSLIDEVIKRHMNQIRYCYQRELTKNPSLGGKVVIKFIIAKDGTVSTASVKKTTMGNAGVEQCIVGRFMRMQFPKPKGGGIVIVSYPFLFSPG
jgi:pSer/pThr/pTyr-binding forkhead associated (FHA) protein/outer membrane biosynthesis protein TonB